MSKVETAVTYEDAGKTLVVDVKAGQDFLAGDQITIADLSFKDFTAVSAADNLWVELFNDNAVTATDDKTITIVVPSISSAANQTFSTGDPATAISTITITDDAVTPRITAASDIRIKFPRPSTWSGIRRI